jgi:hypothetical protein
MRYYLNAEKITPKPLPACVDIGLGALLQEKLFNVGFAALVAHPDYLVEEGANALPKRTVLGGAR